MKCYENPLQLQEDQDLAEEGGYWYQDCAGPCHDDAEEAAQGPDVMPVLPDEAQWDLDVPAGELCQEGPLQLGTGPKPVDGEVDAKSAKKSNNLVSNVLIYDYFWLFTLRQNWMMCNKTL